MNSAKMVQCIHTSSDKGTYKRDCHQNWMLGTCGWYQAAAGPPPLGSHGLCPYFYNSAFENKFYAIQRPDYCPLTNRIVSVNGTSNLYYMGYQNNVIAESSASSVIGDFYANTYKLYPFNKP